MRLFGIDITFIDRSKENDAIKSLRHGDLVEELSLNNGSWDEQQALAAEAYALRVEMINRGYLDADDYPEMQY